MTTINYKLFEALQDAGVSKEKALKAAEGWVPTGEIVTKAELQAELAKLENRLTWRIGGVIVAGVIVLGIMRFFM